MGGLISQGNRYDSSMEEDDSNPRASGRRRSNSNIRRNSNSFDQDLAPVRPGLLSVPCGRRHPFADYRFHKKIGSGSFSNVYKGVSVTNPNITVAIKEVRIMMLTKNQIADMKTEMNILSQLRHANIVRLVSVFVLPEKTFMVGCQNFVVLTSFCSFGFACYFR